MSKMKTGLPARGICFDFETSGYNPPVRVGGHFTEYAKKHQGISLGAVVFDIQTFEALKTFYVEIKFDATKYEWSMGAEKVHGLTREHLEKNGVSQEDAFVAFVNFIIDNGFTLDEELILMGHNKDFDIDFLDQLAKDATGEETQLKISYRGINTSDIGLVCFGLVKSDMIFDHIGLPPRKDHNSLEDALYTLQVCSTVKAIVNSVMKP